MRSLIGCVMHVRQICGDRSRRDRMIRPGGWAPSIAAAGGLHLRDQRLIPIDFPVFQPDMV